MLFTFLSIISFAQVTYSVGSHPFKLFDMSGAIKINNIADDQFSTIIPIGFDFYFYNKKKQNMVIGSNGIISFNTSLAGQTSFWSFDTTLFPSPSREDLLDCILGLYHDIDLNTVSNAIKYKMFGLSPNRYLVVSYDSIPHFSCSTLQSTFQIILYEGSDVIEVQIKEKPICPTWNAGAALVAIQNDSATHFLAAPLRTNATPWTAANEGWRFTPSIGSSVKNRMVQNSSVFPNPVNDKIYIRNSIAFDNYKIHGIDGKVILAGKFENEIDVQALSQGVYYLNLYAKDKISVLKIIKSQ